jgi:hypothetical protein
MDVDAFNKAQIYDKTLHRWRQEIDVIRQLHHVSCLLAGSTLANSCSQTSLDSSMRPSHPILCKLTQDVLCWFVP